jgi:hypothetical protein
VDGAADLASKNDTRWYPVDGAETTHKSLGRRFEACQPHANAQVNGLD